MMSRQRTMIMIKNLRAKIARAKTVKQRPDLINPATLALELILVIRHPVAAKLALVAVVV